MRKGQITVFIILGIVLLSLVIISLYANLLKKISLPSSQEEEAKRFFQSCIEKETLDGIQLLGIRGGYLKIKEPYLELNYTTIPYYFYETRIIQPSKKDIELELRDFITKAISVCYHNLSIFEEIGYSIDAKEPKTDVLINNENIILKIKYLLIFSKNEISFQIDDFNIQLPVRLGYVYDVASRITENTAKNQKDVDMTFLSGFDVKVEIMPSINNSLVYAIGDEKSRINGEPFIFLIAHKLIVNSPPSLNVPDILTFKKDKVAVFKIDFSDAENDAVLFSDDTSLFDITSDGVILFTPKINGKYDVRITAKDSYGNIAVKKIKIVIE